MKDGSFIIDIQGIRDRARKHVEQGAMTAGYKGKPDVVLRLLNDALATELVCTFRYKRHYFMAKGINSALPSPRQALADFSSSTSLFPNSTVLVSEVFFRKSALVPDPLPIQNLPTLYPLADPLEIRPAGPFRGCPSRGSRGRSARVTQPWQRKRASI